jgi:DNA polymerase III gamma/tau subunit
LTRITRAIADSNAKEALLTVDELISRGQDLRNFCRDLLSFFRDLLVFKMAGDSENLLDTAVLSREEMRINAAPFNESDFIRFFNSLSETETKLKEATQSRYVLEIGLVKLIEMRRLAPIEKILERLAKLESALSNGNFPATNITEEKSFISSQPPEKKTLKDDSSSAKYDFSPEEVPFAIGNAPNSKFVVQDSHSLSAITVENVQTSPIADQTVFEAEFVAEETFVKENQIIDEQKPTENNQKSDHISTFITAEFLDTISIKLPQIPSEELEHIEDNWLDAAYEAKLAREGDNLLPIKNAAKIVELLFGALKPQAPLTNFETTNGATAAAPAKEKSSFVMPSFDYEEESSEILVLPENPTEEELLVYAHSHPLVKKALRIFRGKIVEIKKLDDSKNFLEQSNNGFV